MASTANIESASRCRAWPLLKTLDPDARVLADYGWGGYVIHELYQSGGRVFVDGRNDMYDQQVLEDYDSIKNADPNWQALADRYGVDAILLKPEATVTRGPAESAGWCEQYSRRERSPLPAQLPLTQLRLDRLLLADAVARPHQQPHHRGRWRR